MPEVLIDVLFALVMSTAGIVLGYFLRARRTPRSEPTQTSEESEDVRRAREILARVHELTDNVAADVGAHTSRVEEINEELSSGDTGEAEAVISAMNKLMVANEQMQQQLNSADEKLKEQADLIESTTAEARTDALTKLANRRAFDALMVQRIAEFQRHGRTFSVIMMDMDHFKIVNDTHGHQAGDEVLRVVGGVLRDSVREMDVPARYGGEEFAVILPGTPIADAIAGAERIRKMIDDTVVQFGGSELRVTISIGVAELLAAEDVAAMIDRADAGLYASKEAGRNQTHWHDGKAVHPVRREEELVAAEPEPEDAQTEHSESPPETPQPAPVEPSSARQPEEPRPKVETTESESAPPEKDSIQDTEPPAPPEEPESIAEASSPQEEDVEPQPESDPPSEKAGTDASRDFQIDTDYEPCDWSAFGKMLGHRLAEWKRGGEPPGVVLIRIDDYSGITSRNGTEAGNQALRAMSHLLRAALRDMDLMARHGAGTFAVLLPGVNAADSVSVAERIRESIAQGVLPLENGQVHFTVSIGVASATGNEDALRLLHRTLEALDAALKSGGNCCYFHNGQWAEMAGSVVDEVS